MYYTYAYCDPDVESQILSQYGCYHLPFYIGYGTKDRFLAHLKNFTTSNAKKSNPIKCAKIQKITNIGKQPIIFILTRFAEKKTAIQHEIELINSIGTIAKVQGIEKRGPLSNLQKGGHGGSIPKTEEGRKSISVAFKNIPKTAEHRAKISIAKIGNSYHSEESKKLISERTTIALQDIEIRKRISAAHLGKSKSTSHRKKLAEHLALINKDPNMIARRIEKLTGQKRTEEVKLKIATETRKAMASPEVILKMKKSSKNRWADPAERQKISEKMDEILNY